MDRAIAFASDGADFMWSDNQSLSSDEERTELITPPTPSHQQAAWLSATSVVHFPTGQISPASSAMDTNPLEPTAPPMAHSNSSCTDSWSSGGAEREDVETESQWEQGSDDVLAVAKLEPMEDELNLNDLQAVPPVEPAQGAAAPKQKRPRGRPRKHPLTPVVPANKVTKGRSKTGCITCRKRKKKCDEAKPRCMNCEKNAVVCEGYHEKQIWRSGRERAEDERMKRGSLPAITIQPLFHGVETTEDKIFWKHYVNHLSNVLTVEGEAKNAFKDILLHLANQHQDLMHSILAVSSKHIDLDAPYGAKILQENPSVSRESLQERSDYHHNEALTRLWDDKSLDKDSPDYETVLSAKYGQMLCLLLKTRAEGNTTGEHRLHLQYYQRLIKQTPPQDSAVYSFITEFFQYHIYADDLLWHPEMVSERLSNYPWHSSTPIYSPRLMGVADGLFKYLSQITSMRNAIRANISSATDPLVDYTSLYRAAEIEAAIQQWTSPWPAGDSRERVGLLYKQMLWVYLFRTIYPPTGIPTPVRRSTFDSFPIPQAPPMPQRRASMAGAGLLLGQTAEQPTTGNVGAQSCLPPRHPQRTHSMHEQDTHTLSTQPAGNVGAHSCLPPRHPLRTHSMHEQGTHTLSGNRTAAAARRSSPPPIRRPAHHDKRITIAVDESLAILESFGPSDPVQTLLLIPCLVIGTTCFDTSQQDRIRKAVRAVRGYTGLRNCDRVADLLEEVWHLMDKGQWMAVWDWQGVARRRGLDILCA